jgi:hypothetical protein
MSYKIHWYSKVFWENISSWYQTATTPVHLLQQIYHTIDLEGERANVLIKTKTLCYQIESRK